MPLLIETDTVQTLVNYFENNFADIKDVMIIINDEEQEKVPELESLCQKYNWKYCKDSEIYGSEAFMVIVFDYPGFSYEVFSRGKHRLIIVHIKDKR